MVAFSEQNPVVLVVNVSSGRVSVGGRILQSPGWVRSRIRTTWADNCSELVTKRTRGLEGVAPLIDRGVVEAYHLLGGGVTRLPIHLQKVGHRRLTGAQFLAVFGLQADTPETEVEETEVEETTPLEEEAEETDSAIKIADEDLVVEIPVDGLREDPKQYSIAELRTWGSSFDPAVNGTSKEAIASAILSALEELGLA